MKFQQSLNKVCLLLTFLMFTCCSTSVLAAEELEDNQLDLKTDRLENDQSNNQKQKSTVDESLFDATLEQKLNAAKKKEKQTQEKQMSHLFTEKQQKRRQLADAKHLFETTDSSTEQNLIDQDADKEIAAEQTSGTSNHSSFLALFGGLGLIGTGSVVSYRVGKRG